MSKNFKKNIRHLKLNYCQPADFHDNELPFIKPCNKIPCKLISFKECKKSKDYDAWIHFYIDDVDFEGVWTNPNQYIELFSKFGGIIMPDYSIYWDAPNPVTHWNLYRSRVIGKILQDKGFNVIPTVPFGTFEFNQYALKGLEKDSIVCVSTVGSRKEHFKRMAFQNGLDVLCKKLQPNTILVYGDVSDFDFHGIKTISYAHRF